MRKCAIRVVLVSLLAAFRPAPTQGRPAGGNQIQIELDASEAEAVLAILDAKAGSLDVPDVAWQRLFMSPPYTRLKKREESFHNGFTEDDFKAFVLSPGGHVPFRVELLRRK